MKKTHFMLIQTRTRNERENAHYTTKTSQQVTVLCRIKPINST